MGIALVGSGLVAALATAADVAPPKTVLVVARPTLTDSDRAEQEIAYRLTLPFSRMGRHAQHDRRPPPGQVRHPAVMASPADRRAYAFWLARKTGFSWCRSAEAHWETASRGWDGNTFPWGDSFDPEILNSTESGLFDAVPVDWNAKGASVYCMLNAADQVLEPTAMPGHAGRFIGKGASWDDKRCGVCCPAAIKHILTGVRLIRDS